MPSPGTSSAPIPIDALGRFVPAANLLINELLRHDIALAGEIDRDRLESATAHGYPDQGNRGVATHETKDTK